MIKLKTNNIIEAQLANLKGGRLIIYGSPVNINEIRKSFWYTVQK